MIQSVTVEDAPNAMVITGEDIETLDNSAGISGRSADDAILAGITGCSV
jgi:hypothetical protein